MLLIDSYLVIRANTTFDQISVVNDQLFPKVNYLGFLDAKMNEVMATNRVLTTKNNNSFFSSSFWIHVKVYIVPFWEHCGGVGMGVNYLFQNKRSFLLFNQISPWLFCTGTQEQGNAVEVAGKTAVSDTARPPPWRIINGRRRLAKSHKTTLPNSTLNTSRPNLYPYWTHEILRCSGSLVVPWINQTLPKAQQSRPSVNSFRGIKHLLLMSKVGIFYNQGYFSFKIRHRTRRTQDNDGACIR